MPKKLRKIIIKKKLTIVLWCLSVIMASSIYQQISTLNAKLVLLEKNKRNQTLKAAQNINQNIGKRLAEITPIVDKLALAIEKKSKNLNIEAQLEQIASINSEFRSVGICYTPYSHHLSQRLYAPRYTRYGRQLKKEHLEDSYDYTLPENIVYHEAILHSGDWSSVHYDSISRKLVVQYSKPFHLKNKVIGYVYVQLDIDHLISILEDIDLSQNSYYFLLDSSNRIISHPVKKYVSQLTPISNLSKTFSGLHKLVTSPLFDMQSFVKIKDVVSGSDSWHAKHKISTVNWTLVLVHKNKDVFFEDLSLSKDILKTITLSILLACLVYGAVLFSFNFLSKSNLWTYSITTSLLLCLGIAAIWKLNLDSPIAISNSSEDQLYQGTIYNATSLKSFKNRYTERSITESNSLPLYVPTGLFIQTVEFSNKNNLEVTGYVWQKYPSDYQDDIAHGIVFPDAVETNISSMADYTKEYEDHKIYGWYFEVTLRENFNLERYPLDFKKIGLRMWHKDFFQNIVLTPDLSSYNFMAPSSLPGIENKVVSQSWELDSSYYKYEPNAYNVNFGLRDYEGQDEFPELQFNLIMRRSFIGPFISNIIPLIVIALVLFFTVIGLEDNRKKDSNSSLGFSASITVQVMAVLFFGILYSHVSLRQSLPVKDVFYLEYFYFTIYCIMVVVAVNAFLFAWNHRPEFLFRDDNLYFKLLYWPLLCGLLFCFTIYVFY